MSWADLGGFSDGQRPRKRAGPPNRRLVSVITCPTCDGTHIIRHEKLGPVYSWRCLAERGCPTWKEPADIGGNGKAHIA